MADVTPSGPDETHRWDDGRPRRRADRNRGQLLLITALSLAVILISLSFILNSAIYAENLAARESDVTGASFAVESVAETRDGVGGVLRFVNRNESTDTYGTRTARFGDGVAEWQKLEAQYLAFDGARFAVNVSDTREGVRVADDNASSAYLPRGGATTWRVAEDARVRNVRLTVNRSTGRLRGLSTSEAQTLVGSLSGDGFLLRVHNASVDWRVAVYSTDGGANTTVMSYSPGESVYRTCSAAGDSVDVDVTSARLDGRYCRALSVVAFDGERNVTFVNGDDAAGTYALTTDRIEESLTRVVNRENYGDQCTETFYDAGAGDPYTSEAIYSSNLSTAYEGPTVVHETTIRVAPEEDAPPATGPTIDQYTVTGASNTTFTVDWTVSDPNGDLDSVTFTLDDRSDGNASTTTTVSGASATDTQTLSVGDGGTYDLRVTVVDDDGNSRSVTLVEEDDGTPGGCPI